MIIINFTSGRFSKDQTDFSTDGELLKPINMEKIMSGNLELELIDNQFSSQEFIHLNFTTYFFNSINIELYKYIWNPDTLNFHSGLFFRNIVNDSITKYRFSGIDNYGNTINDQLMQLSYNNNDQSEWVYLVNTSQLILPLGTYEIYPYFKINHNFLPSGLIKLLGGDEVLSFSNEYLRLPIDIMTDFLIIN